MSTIDVRGMDAPDETRTLVGLEFESKTAETYARG